MIETMEKRINLYELEPGALKAMLALENFIQSSKLSKVHLELIKIRSSQINNCAYCLNMHTRDALKNGETQQRIFLVSAWRETALFSEEEQVILSMTEEITLIHQTGLSAKTYQKAKALFDDHYISLIIMSIVCINSWNRIAVSTHTPID